jgi:nucleotide-binding universal stress UspA family protein
MRKNILLPTDFSDNAWSAAQYAFKLYKHVDCTFYFLHSSNLPVVAMQNVSNKLGRIVGENTKKELMALSRLAKETNANPKHEFKTILSIDDLHEALETYISRMNVDLIIMGTKGATNAQERFFGSNTVNIIQKIKSCPVLAIPDNYKFAVPKEIAFPTDFNRVYGDELQPLKELASLYDSNIEIVHLNKTDDITELQDQNLDGLKEALKDFVCSLHWVPEYNTKNQGIKDFLEHNKTDILVMINYKQGIIERLIKEPVIKNIGIHPIIPFLVIPSQGK